MSLGCHSTHVRCACMQLHCSSPLCITTPLRGCWGGGVCHITQHVVSYTTFTLLASSCTGPFLYPRVRTPTSPSIVCCRMPCSMSTQLALPCSEKLDVEDHYVAWRQTHDQPQHQFGLDGPFSFCSYPFLLNPRAKSKLLHTEARFLMTQVTATPHHTIRWLHSFR